MEANVQSGRMVTYAELDKPKESLWHKDSGPRIIQNIIQDGKVACVDCTDFMKEITNRKSNG